MRTLFLENISYTKSEQTSFSFFFSFFLIRIRKSYFENFHGIFFFKKTCIKKSHDFYDEGGVCIKKFFFFLGGKIGFEQKEFQKKCSWVLFLKKGLDS